METLTLEQAAGILRMHKVTVRNKARAGELPAAKVGKRWLFLEVDLMNWLRLQYSPLALQGDKTTEIKLCHSTNVKTVPSGGLRSASTDDEYRKALGLRIDKPPKNTTTD
ncbi:helix-turn-helix domain-containing protein [Methyloglobulus morosus]|uniref:helix-turn-helix domain-containing protein n=1 Tax=Methyloglobulus morosus TaxID=1410681 RepID=UPI000565B6F7